MKKAAGAIFDADGTIFDSMYIWEQAGENYLNSKGIKGEDDLQEKLETMTMEESAAYFRREYGVSESVEDIIREVNCMIFRCYKQDVKIKPGLIQVLEDLKKRRIPMYIATSTDRPLIEAALESNEIKKYFKGIITTAEVGKGKREPDIYEIAKSRLNTGKEEIIVFEDALFAAQTAKQAGFFVIGIYDTSEKNQEELRSLVDRYLYTWEEWRLEE